ncbi:MAG: hypothetical protein ACT4P0_08775 [Panacagrimonas sp.]
MFGKFAKSLKDGALGIALKHYLNDTLSEFGEVLDCTVESENARISLRALLKGEREPISAAVEHYELSREGETFYATLRGFSSSRPWLTLLLDKLFMGKRYKLPSAVGNLLE